MEVGPEGQGRRDQNDVFGFLTTEPNALVKQYHPKAMPVILTTQDEIDTWMEAPTTVALVLARGSKQDGLPLEPVPDPLRLI
jgi:putative SOS response-associated peptidase YedK